MKWWRRDAPGLRAGRFAILSALLVLVFTACAEEAPQPPATTQVTSTMDDTHDMSAVDHDDASEHMDDEGHEHDEDGREWEGTPPVLELRIDQGPEGPIAVLEASGFSFIDPSRNEHVPGLGHTHVFVDGTLVQMAYQAEVPLGELDPGSHHIEVTLAGGDHADYLIDGEVLGVSTMLEVAGEVEPAALSVSLEIAGGSVEVAEDRVAVARHGIVEITITSDVADEVHVHGYDIRRAVEPGVTTAMRFPADIPGVFEVELEDSGALLFELTVE